MSLYQIFEYNTVIYENLERDENNNILLEWMNNHEQRFAAMKYTVLWLNLYLLE